MDRAMISFDFSHTFASASDYVVFSLYFMPIFGRSDAALPAVAARQVFIRIGGIFNLQKPDDGCAGKTLPDFWMWV